MITCALIGDFNAKESCAPFIESFIEASMKLHKVDTFVILGHGNFAVFAAEAFMKVKAENPHIKGKILLSFWDEWNIFDRFKSELEIIFLYELSFVTEKFALSACHRIMISFSDIIGIYNFDIFSRYDNLDMRSKELYDITR